jgi:hypothetical protein
VVFEIVYAQHALAARGGNEPKVGSIHTGQRMRFS